MRSVKTQRLFLGLFARLTIDVNCFIEQHAFGTAGDRDLVERHQSFRCGSLHSARLSADVFAVSKATVNPGGTVSFKHQRGSLYFSPQDCRIIKTASNDSLYAGRRGDAS